MALEVTSAEIRMYIDILERKTDVGVGPPSSKHHRIDFSDKLAAGTGLGGIGAVYSAKALDLSSPVTLDLSGSLTSVLDGSVVSFPIVIGFWLINLSTTSGEEISVGGGSDGSGTSAFVNWIADGTDILRAGPSGYIANYSPIDGFAVTNSSADILRIAAVSGSPTCDLLIAGRAS